MAIHIISGQVGYGVTAENRDGLAYLLRTTDGGKRWSIIRNYNGSFTFLSWSGEIGVATLETGGSVRGQFNVELIVTKNEGESWHSVRARKERSNPRMNWGIEPYAHVMGNGSIWILESPEAATTGMQAPVWVSHNGSNSFHQVTLPNGTTSTGGFSADASGKTVALTVEKSSSRTFSVLVGNDRIGWTNIGPHSATPIYAIDYASKSQIFVGGGNFAKFVISPAEEVWSIDPAHIVPPQILWRREAPRIGQYQPIVALQIRHGNGYFLTGGIPMGGELPAPGPLFTIHNGGKCAEKTPINGITFDTFGQSVWVAGDGQALYKSSNYGTTWHPQSKR